MVSWRPPSSPRGVSVGWPSTLQLGSRLPPERAVGLSGTEVEAVAQVAELGLWYLWFQGPAMRAPPDAAEGSRVGVRKEDGGVTPSGEQLTPSPRRPQPRGTLSCPSFICPVNVAAVKGGRRIRHALPWRARRVGGQTGERAPVTRQAWSRQLAKIPRPPLR